MKSENVLPKGRGMEELVSISRKSPFFWASQTGSIILYFAQKDDILFAEKAPTIVGKGGHITSQPSIYALTFEKTSFKKISST